MRYIMTKRNDFFDEFTGVDRLFLDFFARKTPARTEYTLDLKRGVVTVDVPGATTSTLEVDVRSDSVRVSWPHPSGEKRSVQIDLDDHRIDVSAATATLSSGVLTVSFPPDGGNGTRRVPVTTP
jgi:HSP20 family molecular chaperone IbpA